MRTVFPKSRFVGNPQAGPPRAGAELVRTRSSTSTATHRRTEGQERLGPGAVAALSGVAFHALRPPVGLRLITTSAGLFTKSSTCPRPVIATHR